MALGQTIGSMFGLGPQTPEAPDYVPIEMRDVLRSTAAANIAAMPRIERLASKLNQFNVQQDLSTLEQLFPGAGAIIGQASQNIQSQLRGELPADVEQRLRQYANEANVAAGVSGSQFGGYRTARDLGLTSLNMTQQGLASAERWIAQSRARVPLFNPATMFATPAQGLANAQFNTTNQFNVDWLQNQLAAQGDVWEQYALQSIGQMDQLAFSAGTFGLGGLMGGGGLGGGGALAGYQPGGGSMGTPLGESMAARGAAMLPNQPGVMGY